MPIDASIPLQAGIAQAPDPLTQYAKFVGVQQAVNQGRLADLQIRSLSTQLDRDAAIRANLAKLGPNASAADVAGVYMTGGDAPTAVKLQQGAADLDLKKAQFSGEQLKNLGLANEQVGQLLSGVKDQPSYEAAVQTAINSGNPQVAQMAAQFYQQYPQYNPDAVGAAVQRSLKVKDWLDLQGQAAGRTETARHNKADEATAAGNLAVARAKLDPNFIEQEAAAKARGANAALFGDLSGTGAPAAAAPGVAVPGATAPAAPPSAPPILALRPGAVGGPGVEANAPAAPGAPAAAPGGSPLAMTGDAVLARLPAGAAATVRGMVDGRLAPPGGMAMKTPYWQQLIGIASQVDPTFDATKWAARNKLRSDIESTNGTAGRSIGAVNTAVGHLDDFLTAFDKLGNSNTLPGVVNPVVNAVKGQFSGQTQEALGQLGILKQGLAGEINKAFVGAAGGEAEREALMKRLSEANSPNEMQAVAKEAISMLASRVNTLHEQWTQGMGSVPPPQMLSDRTREILQRRGLDPEKFIELQNGVPAAAGAGVTHVYVPGKGLMPVGQQ